MFERHNGVKYTPEMKPFVDQMLHKRVIVKIHVDKYVSLGPPQARPPRDERTPRLTQASEPSMDVPYYGRDLALVHHLGYGFHADACAPGILRRLEPVWAPTVSSSSLAAAPAC